MINAIDEITKIRGRALKLYFTFRDWKSDVPWPRSFSECPAIHRGLENPRGRPRIETRPSVCRFAATRFRASHASGFWETRRRIPYAAPSLGRIRDFFQFSRKSPQVLRSTRYRLGAFINEHSAPPPLK